MVAIMVLFLMDWKLLDTHGKAHFSRWWILVSPVYLIRRSKALGEGWKLPAVWLAVWVFYGTGCVIFNSGTALLERSACDVVTDIYHNQLRQYGKTCQQVTLLQTRGKEHYGLARLTDGSTRDISVSETSGGQIYVTLE
ncbi:hypothetical protein ABC733_03410 [Mangrovibacter sp. SLW1]